MKIPFVIEMLSAIQFWTVRLAGDRRGAVAVIYAVLVLTMLGVLGAGMDLSNALQVKYRLDLAGDAAALACGETWQSNMEQGAAAANTPVLFAQLETASNTLAQAQAKNTFLAQAGQLGPLLSTGFPSVSTTDSASTTTGGASVTCAVKYQAANPNFLMQIVGFNSLTVSNDATSTVNLAPFTQVFLILDTSASMMVGSTPADQGKIATFVANANPSLLANGDTAPCAYACHDTTPFHVSDMQAGESNAHLAGATTRFDVMRLALVNDPVTQSFCTTATNTSAVTCGSLGSQEGLLPYIRDTYQVTNARANLNTFIFNMYGFNAGINGNEPPASVLNQDIPDQSQTVVTNTANLSTVAAGINHLTIGIDTHLMPPMPNVPGRLYSKTQNSVLQDLVTIVGSNNNTCAPGSCSNNPLKFVIIMTDGMNSDRNWNWCIPAFGGFCNNDTTPAGSPSVTTPASTVCNNWKGTPLTFNGSPLWVDTKGLGECGNSSYRPGFWANAITPEFPNPQNDPPGFPVPDPNNPAISATPGNKPFIVNYASAIDTDTTTTNLNGKSFCSEMKANGGVGNGTIPGTTIAVLETPYVPLNGQDPSQPTTPNYPYEGGVQQIIYPFGNPTLFPAKYPAGPHGEAMNALSNALFACSSGSDFYFQASTDAQITTGFIQLFNNFVGQYVHLTQ